MKFRIPLPKKTGGPMKSKKDYSRYENRKIAKEEKESLINSDEQLLFSDCCRASVEVECGMTDFIGEKNPIVRTCWYKCPECGKACNPIQERDL